jgi:DNA-directed RNA polymerase, mitochondrial
VEDNREKWLSIAADPLADKSWTSCDKPFVALAAILDWVGFLKQGFGYVSHLPVHVDGTCNGIQHLAAMTRDAVAGQQVNLTPNEQPADIYQTVADLLTEDLERIARGGGEQADYAAYWLELTEGRIPRGLTKRPVMVLPYGGTREAFYTYVGEWLDENHPETAQSRDLPEPERLALYILRCKRLAMLTARLWDIVKSTVHGGVTVMKWLQDCAKLSTESNQPIFWKTPSGFIVRHFYGVQKQKTMTLHLNGERTTLALSITTKDLDIQSQLRGIAPNFVHSLDASALVDTLVMAREAGIGAVTTVHDAYGTHAADMWDLFKLLRTAFVQTHNEDIVGMFRDACQRIMVGVLVSAGKDPLEAAQLADEALPQRPEMGDLDLSVIHESDYFFA